MLAACGASCFSGCWPGVRRRHQWSCSSSCFEAWWLVFKRHHIFGSFSISQFFPHQTYINLFVMWTDSDHAGCIKTRKSVSGGVLMAGGCCIKTYSKGQGAPTGEAEYYSLVSGASNLLGEVSTALDWGIKTENEVNMDASAGISLGSRRGLGKAKHVDAQFHWVLERVAQRNFRIKKVGTNDMLADVLTKPVPEATMNKALLGMNFHFLEGQHQLSLKK